MTVTQSFSLSLTYTSLRMYMPQTVPASVPAASANTAVAPAADTVTLSPEATAPAGVEETPEVPPAPTSRAAQRAEILLDALDADQDGAVTKEEFLDGAMALLRRAGARHRHHRAHGEGHDRHGHEGHKTNRLERKLDRLFDRVDASGDDNVDEAELTDALTKVTRERRPDTTETPAAPSAEETQAPAPVSEPQTPPAAAVFYSSVTVVIAMRQYTSVAAMAA